MSLLRTIAAALVTASVAFNAAAQSPGQSRSLDVGTSTRSLLELQRSGQQAGPELPMLGAASALSYQRYLDSHKHPIPAAFTSTVGGGSGGQSR